MTMHGEPLRQHGYQPGRHSFPPVASSTVIQGRLASRNDRKDVEQIVGCNNSVERIRGEAALIYDPRMVGRVR